MAEREHPGLTTPRTRPSDDWSSRLRRVQATHLIALVILGMAVKRMMCDTDACRGSFDDTTLLYLFGAAAVLLLSRAKTFQFGDLKVELELARMREDVEEAKLTASIAEDTARHAAADPSARVARDADALAPSDSGPEPQPGSVHDDPWKGVFGGQSIDKASGRVLSAEVKALGNTPGWYGVTLTVCALPDAPPLEGAVRFYLHDSFVNDRPLVRVAGGQAVLHLKAWGAFTVGAVADGGASRLELDLAGLESAPMEFRLR